MSQVNKTPLSSIVSSTTGGGTPERSNPALWNGGIPWASVKDFQDKNRKLTCTQEEISREGLNRSASHLIPAGTPIICTRMAVGRIAIAAVPTAINQDLRALHLRDGFDVDYVVLAIEGIREKIESLSIGSTVKGISIEQLLRFEIPDFPLEEQTKIAEILSMVDRAIEQTEAFIAKQQRIKTGLMQDLLTRGIDEHGNLRSEETHEFKDSPLGRIPAEWDVSSCAQVCTEIVVGIVIRPAQYYRPDGVPVLRSANVRPNQISKDDLVFMNEVDNEILRKSQLRTGDLVTVRTGYPGTTAVVPPELDKCNCVDIVITRPRREVVRSEFLSIWVNSDNGKRQVLEGQGGLAQQHFNVGEMRKLRVKVPPLSEQERIEATIHGHESLLRRIQSNALKLGFLKKALMQDLLTGKKRVTALLEPEAPAVQTP
ncbi:MAG: restriction endonuclease subunit S [Thiocapsa sp.]|uniref:restriction endonuclease subunit S n=1 Tax=Thiocapsa sp. TaxID=2024551 RepID=UPI001BCBDD49|nr:restriction endonuclease subunit S [Thiocapsa sp.]QVL50401.1 MAG: restriction endonuclease subunit S [Thiocapsa sp.]